LALSQISFIEAVKSTIALATLSLSIMHILF
jgi:hypothetical protein